MYSFSYAYPTPHHERAASRVVEHFARQDGVEAVLLTCSCARGKAAWDSCLDMVVLLDPEQAANRRPELEQGWTSIYPGEPVFEALLQVGPYTHVDLILTDGHFSPDRYWHGWTLGPDFFELEIGNTFAYTVPLWQRGDAFDQLKARWLPYYDEALRQERLAMVRQYCLNNLHHIPRFVERGLYFQAFRRLYDALGEFLQALFIARRTYPIAYDKWIQEQIVEILQLPALYPQLVQLLETHHLEGRELVGKAQILEELLEQYTGGEIDPS
ncbi:MAG: hypothetical protein K8J31_10005 [Anaerolineae bacterium]|nr:hypothetical protein [Anaerolineae bacterium]